MDTFGFTFEEEITSVTYDNRIAELEKTVKELNELVDTLIHSNKAMFTKTTNLLLNLKRDPTKPKINWPNREQAIDKFLTELNELKVTRK